MSWFWVCGFEGSSSLWRRWWLGPKWIWVLELVAIKFCPGAGCTANTKLPRRNRYSTAWWCLLITSTKPHRRCGSDKQKILTNSKRCEFNRLSLTSSIKAMVPLTCTIPICSLCKDGWALTLKPAEFLATNFLSLFGWWLVFLAKFWFGGVIPCGGSTTSTLKIYNIKLWIDLIMWIPNYYLFHVVSININNNGIATNRSRCPSGAISTITVWPNKHAFAESLHWRRKVPQLFKRIILIRLKINN